MVDILCPRPANGQMSIGAWPPQVGERPRQFHAGAAEGSGGLGAGDEVAAVLVSLAQHHGESDR